MTGDTEPGETKPGGGGYGHGGARRGAGRPRRVDAVKRVHLRLRPELVDAIEQWRQSTSALGPARSQVDAYSYVLECGLAVLTGQRRPRARAASLQDLARSRGRRAR